MHTNGGKILSVSILAMSFCLIAWTPQPAQTERKYVRSIEEFKLHTNIHRHYVMLLGMALYQKYQDFFRDVPIEALQYKLMNHDYEKIASLPELKAMGYKDERTFLERLYELYHIDNEKMSAEDKADFNELRNSLNKFAGRYQHEFLKKFGLYQPDGITIKEAAAKIFLIERIADLVERDESLVSREEFNRAKMRDARDYFDEQLFKNMAAFLEENYHGIVPENPLVQSYRERFYETGKVCSLLFAS